MYNIEEIKKAKGTDTFEFVCEFCGKKFIKTKREISRNKYALPKFCCQQCQREWYKTNSYITVKCNECDKEITIPKRVYNKSKNKHFFCNNSCAAKYNNKRRKRKTKGFIYMGEKHRTRYNKCPVCGKLKTSEAELCFECRKKAKKRDFKARTLGLYIEGQKYLTSKCGDIRRDARRTIEESKVEKVCAYCRNHEFDDILEVHHIKGILEFDKSATISEINDENNLVWLCPNHHRMVELGLINLPQR